MPYWLHIWTIFCFYIQCISIQINSIGKWFPLFFAKKTFVIKSNYFEIAFKFFVITKLITFLLEKYKYLLVLVKYFAEIIISQFAELFSKSSWTELNIKENTKNSKLKIVFC